MIVTAKALGKWSNAPLALVLAQVRFEPFTGMDPAEFKAAFHSKIAAEFPQVIPIQQFSIQFGAAPIEQQASSSTIAGYDLISDDATRVVRIQSGVLTYTVTAYQGYTSFAADWDRLVAALCAIGEVKGLRLGLRYVDFIIPRDGCAPEDYVVAPLGRSPLTLAEQAPVILTLCEYPRSIGQLRIQYCRGFGSPDYPPDLQGMVIPPSILQARYSAGPSAVLDMDRWIEFMPTVMQQVDISEHFQMMHDEMSTVFRQITTPDAHTEWGRNDNEVN